MITSIELRHVIRIKYAWPGGYPMYLVMADGESMCMDCGRKEYKMLARALRDWQAHDEWRPAGSEINWEDPQLTCVHCDERIESAYAEDEVCEVYEEDYS